MEFQMSNSLVKDIIKDVLRKGQGRIDTRIFQNSTWYYSKSLGDVDVNDKKKRCQGQPSNGLKGSG